MLKTKDEKKNPLECFEWDVNSNPIQRLYLSRDTKLMMEVINNFAATVYKRVNIDKMGKSVNAEVDENQDYGQQVKWKVAYRIAKYPGAFCQETSVPYMFSPNFKFQIDVNISGKFFVILECET